MWIYECESRRRAGSEKLKILPFRLILSPLNFNVDQDRSGLMSVYFSTPNAAVNSGVRVGRKRKIGSKNEKGIWVGPVTLPGLFCVVRLKREERGGGNEEGTRWRAEVVSFCASTGLLPTVNWLCRIESVHGEREEDVLLTPPPPCFLLVSFPFLSVYLKIYYRGGIIHPPAWV